MKKIMKELLKADQTLRDEIPQSLKTAFILVVLTVLIIGAIFFSKWEAHLTSVREEVIEALSIMDAQAVVTVDGVKIENPQALIDALMSLDKHNAHHSHPERRVRIMVTSSTQSITLDLGRDSEILDEYWVYDPNRSYLDRVTIGSLSTDLLSEWNGVEIKTPIEIERDKKKGIQPIK